MKETMKKYAIILSTILLTLTGCKDFLAPKSESEFVPRTVQDLDEMLLYETYYGSKQFLTTTFFNLISDDVSVAPWTSSESDLLSSVHRQSIKAIYTWQPDMYYTLEQDHVSDNMFNMYSGGYARILGCNAVLDYMHTVSGTDMEKTRLEAEARTMRAWWYFYLVNVYGAPYNSNKSALGVPLHLTAAVSNENLKRNTVEECYNQVLEDLRIAESLYLKLPEELQWKRNNRASLPFVYLLLSRVNLYMENWKEASDYADKVIADSRFRLLDFPDFPSGSHIEVHTYRCPEVIWPYSYSGEFNEYENPYMMVYSLGGSVAFVIASSELYYKYSADDIRRDQYLVRDVRSINYKAFGKIALKSGSSDPNPNNTFARSLRVSEAYLNKAEAQAEIFKESGSAEAKTSAINTIQALRAKRITNPDNEQIDDRTADRLISSIRDERRRELCFEDHRWFDLRRYGMPRIIHVWYDEADAGRYSGYAMNVEDPQYTLPLPPAAMLLNPALEQNPLGPSRQSL